MTASETKRRRSTAGSLIELVVIVAVALGLALGIQAFLVKPYRIPSESMEPTLDVGQRVLVNRIGQDFGDPSVGDILVFHPPTGSQDNQCGAVSKPGQACTRPTPGEADTNYIKRVVGVPGDRIAIRDGHVVRNGKLQDEPFIRPCDGAVAQCDFPTPFVVPPGHYFMMGDNRGASDDSRFWGPIPKDSVIGNAFATYWPPSRVGFF